MVESPPSPPGTPKNGGASTSLCAQAKGKWKYLIPCIICVNIALFAIAQQALFFVVVDYPAKTHPTLEEGTNLDLLELPVNQKERVSFTWSLQHAVGALWHNKAYVLSVSLGLFSGLLPALMAIMALGVWLIPMPQSWRIWAVGVMEMAAKWTIFDVLILTIWAPSMSFHPVDIVHHPFQFRIDLGWGSLLTCAAALSTFMTALSLLGFEKMQAAERQMYIWRCGQDSLHGIFFGVALLTVVLLMMGLTLPGFTSTINYTSKWIADFGPAADTVKLTHCILTLTGGSIMEDGSWAVVMALIYMVIVTLFPIFSLLSAVLAWVNRMDSYGQGGGLNWAILGSNIFGRLVSLDVWLIGLGLTIVESQQLSAAIYNNNDYTVNVTMKPELGVWCSVGCAVGLLLLHTLARCAQTMDNDEERFGAKAEMEPVFAPPSDLE